MPWVHVTTGKRLSEQEQDRTAAGVAAALHEVIGKDKAGVFVTFVTADAFIWGGERKENAAIFDVRWIGEFGAPERKEISRRLLEEVAPLAGLDGKRTRAIFTSKSGEDWGRPDMP